MGGAGAYARVDDVRRSGNVRVDRLARVRFEDRHVLVRSRVEDDLGTNMCEQRVECRRVADVAQCELSGSVEFLHQVVQVGLVVVEQHQARGRELGHLPRDLGTDPAAAAGHEHAPAREQLPNWREVDRHLVTTEEVFDPQVAQVAQMRHRVHPRRRRGQHPHGDPRLLGGFRHPSQHFRRRRRDRVEHLVHVAVADDPREIVDATRDRDAVDLAAAQRRIVVDGDDGHETELWALAHFPERRGARARRRRRSRRVRRSCGHRSGGRRTVATGSGPCRTRR